MRIIIAGLVAGLALTGTAMAAPAADPAAGGTYFKTNCGICHMTGDKSGPLAPTLKGVVGRKVAGAPDFKYTDAIKKKTGNWTAADLSTFLINPQAVAPGTAMPMSIADAAIRANVVAYLGTLK